MTPERGAFPTALIRRQATDNRHFLYVQAAPLPRLTLVPLLASRLSSRILPRGGSIGVWRGTGRWRTVNGEGHWSPRSITHKSVPDLWREFLLDHGYTPGSFSPARWGYGQNIHCFSDFDGASRWRKMASGSDQRVRNEIFSDEEPGRGSSGYSRKALVGQAIHASKRCHMGTPLSTR